MRASRGSKKKKAKTNWRANAARAACFSVLLVFLLTYTSSVRALEATKSIERELTKAERVTPELLLSLSASETVKVLVYGVFGVAVFLVLPYLKVGKEELLVKAVRTVRNRSKELSFLAFSGATALSLLCALSNVLPGVSRLKIAGSERWVVYWGLKVNLPDLLVFLYLVHCGFILLSRKRNAIDYTTNLLLLIETGATAVLLREKDVVLYSFIGIYSTLKSLRAEPWVPLKIKRIAGAAFVCAVLTGVSAFVLYLPRRYNYDVKTFILSAKLDPNFPRTLREVNYRMALEGAFYAPLFNPKCHPYEMENVTGATSDYALDLAFCTYGKVPTAVLLFTYLMALLTLTVCTSDPLSKILMYFLQARLAVHFCVNTGLLPGIGSSMPFASTGLQYLLLDTAALLYATGDALGKREG